MILFINAHESVAAPAGSGPPHPESTKRLPSLPFQNHAMLSNALIT